MDFSSESPEQKNLLKKIGKGIKKALPVVKQVLPVASQLVPSLKPAAAIVAVL